MNPMKAMNRPIPTPIACFSASGMAFITASRNPVRTRTRMIRPSVTMTPIASGQVRPFPATSWKATTAFRPRPAAMANGYRAISPIASVLTAAARAVEVRTSGKARLSPSRSGTAPRTEGFTNRM
jgi:hypothetical protein